MTESEVYIALILKLLEMIDSPRKLALIYRYVNQTYCKTEG